MKVVLIRHGETEWSRTQRHTGRTDLPLTDAGREQARRAASAAAVGGHAFALVLTSPLRRAKDTAELVGLAGQAQEDPDLREWDYGEYEGRTTADIREERAGWDVWTGGVPAGEPLSAVGERADRVIERLCATDGDVAVFAHGHLLRVLGARWIGLPPDGGGRLKLDTAAVCELGYERERHVLVTWNDTSHLR